MRVSLDLRLRTLLKRLAWPKAAWSVNMDFLLSAWCLVESPDIRGKCLRMELQLHIISVWLNERVNLLAK